MKKLISIFFVIIVFVFSCKEKVEIKDRKKEIINISHDSIGKKIDKKKIVKSRINCNEFIFSKGLIKINLEKLRKDNDTIKILNNDFTLHGRVYENKEEEIISSIDRKGYRALFDDYDIFYIDSENINENDYYEILVDCKKKKIKKTELIKYYSWDEFLKDKTILMLNKKSPLLKINSEMSKIVFNEYQDFSYQVISINGNWAKVKCSIDCEGCPDNNVIIGWVKWKDEKNKLLVDIYYSC